MHEHHVLGFKRRFIASTILTIPIILLSEMTQELFHLQIQFPFQNWFTLILSMLVFVYGGQPFISGLFEEVKSLRPGMMTLVGSAISIAFTYSTITVFIGGREFFLELATLIDVMLLGHWIEAKSVMGASKALENLVRIMPTTAHLIRDNDIIEVSIADLKVEDVVLVRPGEKVPCDGIILEGESSINEALLTGESKPIQKGVRGKVIAGSINVDGTLKVRVERTGEETYIAQVIRLVKQAQEGRSKTQDIADKVAALLFYISLIVGVITFLFWHSISSIDFALSRMVTVLVITCPHALGLAIPLVVALSTSITAKNGILIRNRMAFELIRNVDVVLFDKTGTLTLGSFGVTDIISYIPENELLSLTASLELNSEHIIARAIVEHAKSNNISLHKIEDFRSIPGKGVYGRVNGLKVYVGGQNLINDLGIRINDERIDKLRNQGKTLVFTIINDKLAGVMALSDRVRMESYEAIRNLKNLGIKVYMITGDSEDVAKWVADELNIDEYFAQVLPHEKAERVKSLINMGYRVAMVGDGVNDAPALASANIGIAIGAGTDVAIETADIILVRNNPKDVVKIIDIARKTYSKMIQNLLWATGYNAITIPLAAGTLYSQGILLPPALGAIIMSLSTIIVAINSATLKRYEPKTMELMEKYILIDPVCGMEVNPSQAYGRVEYGKHVIYFCSKECQEKFMKNPNKYISKIKH